MRTGQLISYLLGDDGTHQKTISHSYVDNGDGTITDNLTGLIWQKCSNGQNNDSSCSGTATAPDWASASPDRDLGYLVGVSFPDLALSYNGKPSV
ncbi:MAG: hypothetical protein KBF93_07960 [Leptospiraceae bacterium]|nr:hypothetical protein [Leptospiraceae bacterium]